MSDHQQLIRDYLAGASVLREAVAGLRDPQYDAVPAPSPAGDPSAATGSWTIRQVVCHLADFEPIYADRMKRVIAEHEPGLPSGDPDLFAAALAYPLRSVEQELELIQLTRQQMGTILQTLQPGDFDRIGIHLEAGPLTLTELLQRITRHIPHHVRFIAAKRKAMDSDATAL